MAKGYNVVTKSITIHGVLLRDNTYHVTVKKAIDLEVCLPIPIGDEFMYIKDVVDTIVPWPKHIVFLSTTAKVKTILL